MIFDYKTGLIFTFFNTFCNLKIIEKFIYLFFCRNQSLKVLPCFEFDILDDNLYKIEF